MSTPRDAPHRDLFRPALEEFINPDHPLVRLAQIMDWSRLEDRIRAACRPGPGQPPLASRLVAGLFVLKRIHRLSDEALCARWLENPYDQYFCGEQHFQRKLPFDRSSLVRWRKRLGEGDMNRLIDEFLQQANAKSSGAVALLPVDRPGNAVSEYASPELQP